MSGYTSQKGWESRDALGVRLEDSLSKPKKVKKYYEGKSYEVASFLFSHRVLLLGQWVTKAYYQQLLLCSHGAERKVEKGGKMVAKMENAVH